MAVNTTFSFINHLVCLTIMLVDTPDKNIAPWILDTDSYVRADVFQVKQYKDTGLHENNFIQYTFYETVSTLLS